MAGTSNRRSCSGLLTLTTTNPDLANLPPRSIAASVPSKASTATTICFLTTIVWPIPRRPISLATRKPNRTSSHSATVGERGVKTPSEATICGTQRVEFKILMPSLSNSSATPRSSASSSLFLIRARNFAPRRSGRKFCKNLTLRIPPAITASVMPARRNVRIIFPNCPT